MRESRFLQAKAIFTEEGKKIVAEQQRTEEEKNRTEMEWVQKGMEEYGFTKEEVDRINDPRVLKLLKKQFGGLAAAKAKASNDLHVKSLVNKAKKSKKSNDINEALRAILS